MKFRKATRKDLPAIVEMLANDKLGMQREAFSNPLPASYVKAFEEIEKDPNQELIVGELNGEVISTLQMTYIPGLTYQGSIRVLVEAVRVRDELTGKGIGKQMMEYVVQRAKERDAYIIQLTSNKQRPDAIRFYARLGFEASHEGMKMFLK